MTLVSGDIHLCWLLPEIGGCAVTRVTTVATIGQTHRCGYAISFDQYSIATPIYINIFAILRNIFEVMCHVLSQTQIFKIKTQF